MVVAAILLDEPLGDLSTLRNPESVEEIRGLLEETCSKNGLAMTSLRALARRATSPAMDPPMPSATRPS